MQVCAGYNLRKLARIVTSYFDEVLRPTGIRCTQLSVLGAIGAQQKCSFTDLAESMGMSPSTLSRTLQPLRQKGYISINAAGGKKKSIELTPEGWRFMRTVTPYWERAQADYAQRVPDDLKKYMQVHFLN